MNPEQRIADLQKQLDELKASIGKKEDGLWYPKKDEQYAYVNDWGDIYITTNVAVRDTARFKFHNVFQTQEQAERHAKRLKLYSKLWRLAEHLNGDWVPDFEKYQEKYWIYYDTVDLMFRVSNSSRYFQSDPCFKNHKLAKRAILMLTDEEKEIFKNIWRP